ncbi:MAG: hypothetical protein JWQ71_3247 [Pedosphaera sp.]|nr:hypothetical protein [Pedosphaera sp.]
MSMKTILIRRTILAVLAGLLAFPASTPALMVGHLVTKQTQFDNDMKFTLSAIKESNEAVLVRMIVPREGKLKDHQKVMLELNEGKQILLQTAVETGSDVAGATVISFQISPALADKYYVNLFTEISTNGPAYTSYFSVELKGYVIAKK